MKYAVIAVMSLCASLTAHATSASGAPSIDFINEKNSSSTYESVSCIATAKNGTGQGSLVQGLQDSQMSRVMLKDLMPGADGNYTIQCKVQHRQSSETYQTEFNAVKFTKDVGGTAAQYDENNKAYGVGLTDSNRPNSCYNPADRTFDAACLPSHYGHQSHYLLAIAGPINVEPFSAFYSSHMGVLFKRNPHFNSSSKSQSAPPMGNPFSR